MLLVPAELHGTCRHNLSLPIPLEIRCEVLSMDLNHNFRVKGSRRMTKPSKTPARCGPRSRYSFPRGECTSYFHRRASPPCQITCHPRRCCHSERQDAERRDLRI